MTPTLAVLGAVLVSLSLQLGSATAQPSRPSSANRPPTVRLHSVPDNLAVYISQAIDPQTLFAAANLRGRTPFSLPLKAGRYWVGYLMTGVPHGAQLRVLDEVMPGLRLATAFSGVSVQTGYIGNRSDREHG